MLFKTIVGPSKTGGMFQLLYNNIVLVVGQKKGVFKYGPNTLQKDKHKPFILL